jgi:uncharacterized damage-inducible protein DinB
VSERAQVLADQLEQANHELIHTVEQLSDAQWKATTADEGWRVGVVVHHVATGHGYLSGMVRKIADGDPVAVDRDAIHRANAEHAVQFADVTKASALALLRQNGAYAVAIVRGLEDSQLDRVGGSMGMTTAQAIERVLVGHVQNHHASIRQAVGA